VCLTCLLPSALASSLHTASYAAIHSRENTENLLDSTEIEDAMTISLTMQHIIAAASNPNITTTIIVVIAILACSTDPRNSLTNRKLAWIRLTVVMPTVTIVATM